MHLKKQKTKWHIYDYVSLIAENSQFFGEVMDLVFCGSSTWRTIHSDWVDYWRIALLLLDAQVKMEAI